MIRATPLRHASLNICSIEASGFCTIIRSPPPRFPGRKEICACGYLIEWYSPREMIAGCGLEVVLSRHAIRIQISAIVPSGV